MPGHHPAQLKPAVPDGTSMLSPVTDIGEPIEEEYGS